MRHDHELIVPAQEQDILKKHLNSARMAQLVFAPRTPEANALADYLTALTIQHEDQTRKRKRKRNVRAFRDFRGAVAAFAADLLHHGQFEDAAGFMYRGSDKDLLAQTLVSVRSFEIILRHWPQMGWMDATSFFRVQETWEDELIEVFHGRSRRFRSTDALRQIAEGFGILPQNVREHFAREVGRISAVTVRSEVPKKNGNGLQARNIKVRGPRFDQEEKRVTEINTFLANGGFDLPDPPQVYRLFNRGNYKNFDFNMGGRLYCRSEENWQQMPKAQRALITWQGEETVELDVRASHLFILYALNSLSLAQEDDPYTIPGIDRDVVKGLFAAICGRGGRPTRWPKKLAASFRDQTGHSISKTYNLSETLNALYSKHQVLEKIKGGTLDWARLQYEESECFMECLLALGRDHGIAALPIFDGLIVARRHKEVTEKMLRGAYGNRFSVEPIIRVK